MQLKMGVSRLLFVVAIIASISLKTGQGIRCYECNSDDSPGCAESKTLIEKWEIECSQEKTICRKGSYESKVVLRECHADLGNPDLCVDRDGREDCSSYCKTDLCNGADLASLSVFLSIMPTLVGLIHTQS